VKGEIDGRVQKKKVGGAHQKGIKRAKGQKWSSAGEMSQLKKKKQENPSFKKNGSEEENG